MFVQQYSRTSVNKKIESIYKKVIFAFINYNFTKNMRNLITTVLLALSTLVLNAQNAGDVIKGVWMNGEETAMIRIFKATNGSYAGRIVWLKEPIDLETKKPKLDKKNPDSEKINLPVLTLINLKGFSYNENDKVWENGTVYDPKNGKEYSCKMELKSENVLEVRGFIGLSMFGRTDTWVRQIKK